MITDSRGKRKKKEVGRVDLEISSARASAGRRRQKSSATLGLRQKQRQGNRQCTRGLPVQAQPELDVFRQLETFEIALRAFSQKKWDVMN